jgi:hypothetical protein
MDELKTQNETLRRFIMEHADTINAKREGLVPVTENRIIKVRIDKE